MPPVLAANCAADSIGAICFAKQSGYFSTVQRNICDSDLSKSFTPSLPALLQYDMRKQKCAGEVETYTNHKSPMIRSRHTGFCSAF
ncbi:hypothetical protein thalar_01553 [Litoreibacter arenae DSM 19593]|uniref:Uncharacterized protein n=1 Tax=Litoreibacter arenae DSM 19593 TaxID=1123360 RepID=S9S1X7_9RHOB|nr:hypothetical protein thalar_01553 [Litoreibacter arenae DSM 19593]